MNKNWIPALITGIFFLAVGIVCLLWPEKVQQYYLNFYERHKEAAKFNPFLGWMHTRGYILTLRVIGIAGLIAFILIFFTITIDLIKR